MDSKFILPESVEILDQIGDTSVKSEPSEPGNGELKNLTVTVRGKF